MRLAIIGDSHGVKVPKKKLIGIDAVLISGDLGKSDLARSYAFRKVSNPDYKPTDEERKSAWLEVYNSSLDVLMHYSKIAPVYFIFGNVEMSDSEVRLEGKKIKHRLPLFVRDINRIKDIHLINNRFVNINGVRIGGLENFLDTCWVKEFHPSNYSKKLIQAKRESERAKKVLKWFGKNRIDILLCHQPPYGVLDKVGNKAPESYRGKHAGSKIVLDYIKRKQPQYVFCGHIHEAKGVKRIGKTEVRNLGYNGDYQVIEI